MSGAAVQSFKKAFDGFDPGPDPRPPPPPSAGAAPTPTPAADGDRGRLDATVARAERLLAGFAKVLGLMEDVGLARNVIARAQASHDAFEEEIEEAREAADDLEQVERQLRDETKAVRAEVSEYRATLRRQPVSVGSGGAKVDLFWTDIPGYDELGREERKALAETVAAKVRGGKALYRSIVAGADGVSLPAPTAKEITDLVWALKTSAQTKASSPEVAAIAVPNGAALRGYLDRSTTGTYPVASVRPPRPGESARGIDLPGGTDGALMPAGSNSLIYRTSTGVGGKERLHLKLEPEGRYLGDSVAETDPAAPPPRPLQAHDIKSGTQRVYDRVKAAPAASVDAGALYAQAKALVSGAPPSLRAALKLGLGGEWQAEPFLRALTDSADAIGDEMETGYADAVAAFLRTVQSAYGVADADEGGGEVRLDDELG